MQNKKFIIVNIVFFIIIFNFFLVIIEIVLRTTHMFGATISCSEPDSVVGWRNTPGCTFHFNKENDHPVPVKFNNYGYRDKDWSLKKPNDTYRIAVLGDSFVEALQVEMEHNFISMTEQRLNKRHDINVELMNFGRSGFTQIEELLVLRNEVIQFSPDMVVIFFLPTNDLQEISKKTDINFLRPYYQISENGKLILDTSFTETRTFKIKSFVNVFKQHSALISLLAKRYNAYKQAKQISKAKAKRVPKDRPTGTLSKKLDGYLTLCSSNPNETYLGNYQLSKVLIKNMARFTHEKGVRFMLVTIDIPAYMPEVEKQYTSIDSTFDSNFFEDNLNNFATSLNIEYLGLQRIFKQYYENTGVPLHWSHWNYEGHKVVANALADKMEPIIASIE
jgi:lysophospholipase L1-like esterase